MGTMSGLAARLIGAFAFLLIGVAEVLVVRRSIYPVLRSRHEKAKLTQAQGRDPNWLVAVVWLQGVVVMPALGFMVGGWLSAAEG
jgi:hypothetical protein